MATKLAVLTDFDGTITRTDADLCPAIEADLLFAKAELARLCDQEEIGYMSFDRFADVQRDRVARM